jgi:hypothetical protein
MPFFDNWTTGQENPTDIHHVRRGTKLGLCLCKVIYSHSDLFVVYLIFISDIWYLFPRFMALIPEQ